MNYLSSTCKPNFENPVASTELVLFGDATTQFEIEFVAKMTLLDVKLSCVSMVALPMGKLTTTQQK